MAERTFGGEIIFTARCEPLEERRGKNRRGCGGFDGRENGPAAFAGIRDAARKTFERWLLQERDGGKIEQPGSDHAAAAPDFGDVREIEIVLVMFGIAKRGSFRVILTLRFSCVGVLENVQGLRRRLPSTRIRFRCGPS